ncbi:MAG: hypothetical protein ACFFBE_11460 [Promethearchaeota archaeon]
MNEDKNDKSEDLVLKDIKKFMFLEELEKGGYDLDEWDSYEKKIPEEAKYIIPFLVGLGIAVSIFSAWFFSLTEGEVPEDFSLVMMLLFISILVVEVPIAVIVISLTYRYKVVKMKPTSSYKIENIYDYLLAHEQYQKGNYEYETIKSEKDIINAYENGKKIVFTEQSSGEKGPMWLGIVFWIVGIVVTTIMGLMIANINMEFLWIFLSISISWFSGIGAIFFLPNYISLKRLPRSFFVLGKEGIVYRRKWGDIRSYSWKELDLKIYTITRIPMVYWGKMEIPPTPEIHVILPNHAKLRFKADSFRLDEFLSFDKVKAELMNLDTRYSLLSRSEIHLETRKFILYLVGKTFEYYFKSSNE